MNIPLNLNDSTGRSRETYYCKSSEGMTLDTALPQAARELAEKSLAQTREAYERSKSALEAALDALARSFDALGQGSAALNRKIMEIAHRNVSSGFDLARSLATAKNLAEVVELRAVYWRKQLSSLAVQAEEMRELSAKLGADITAPVKAHVSRSMEEMREKLLPKD
jgi:phasin family protein